MLNLSFQLTCSRGPCQVHDVNWTWHSDLTWGPFLKVGFCKFGFIDCELYSFGIAKWFQKNKFFWNHLELRGHRYFNLHNYYCNISWKETPEYQNLSWYIRTLFNLRQNEMEVRMMKNLYHLEFKKKS